MSPSPKTVRMRRRIRTFVPLVGSLRDQEARVDENMLSRAPWCGHPAGLKVLVKGIGTEFCKVMGILGLPYSEDHPRNAWVSMIPKQGMPRK